MSLHAPRSDTDEVAIAEAERSGAAFLVHRDGEGRQHVTRLAGDGPVVIGRRREADVRLAWDPQVSRVHAELRRMAGEWTVADDGLSQNGTYVNEVRLLGRRRLADRDEIRAGRTVLTFRAPAARDTEPFTPLPGELASPAVPSEQQRAILRELCRPYARDGERVTPATDGQIARALGLSPRTVAAEVRALCEGLGVGDLPAGTARKELARTALSTGIVSYEDLL